VARVTADPADQTAAALIQAWQALMDAHPDAWMEVSDGIAACVTGIPSPGLNGIWCARRDPDPDELRRLLVELKDRGVPHLLELRPGTDEAALAVAAESDLVPADDMPLMRLDDPGEFDRARAAAPMLSIRELGPDEAALHARVAAAGFGENPDHFVRLLPPVVMAVDGFRAYAGEVDGEVVTTAVGVTLGDYVGVFNVATPADHRRRGYGAAITARVVEDGFANGASWAWLQSSPSGYGVYEALGFRTLERWLTWVRV
jgi:ribosomal protein S18 acetylase RimI-like enzyme